MEPRVAERRKSSRRRGNKSDFWARDPDVDGCQKETVRLKWSSGTTVRMDTSDITRKVELDAKIQYLNQTLHEKWEEYKTLVMKEQQLVLRKVGDEETWKTLESVKMLLIESVAQPGGGPLGACCAMTSSSVSCTQSSSSTDRCEVSKENVFLTYDRQAEADRRSRTSTKPMSALLPQMGPNSPTCVTSKTRLTRSVSTRSSKRVPEGGTVCEDSSYQVLSRMSKMKTLSRHFLKRLPRLGQTHKDENHA